MSDVVRGLLEKVLKGKTLKGNFWTKSREEDERRNRTGK